MKKIVLLILAGLLLLSSCGTNDKDDSLENLDSDKIVEKEDEEAVPPRWSCRCGDRFAS